MLIRSSGSPRTKWLVTPDLLITFHASRITFHVLCMTFLAFFICAEYKRMIKHAFLVYIIIAEFCHYQLL